MKQLNIYFEDSEYKELLKLKKLYKLTWHDFIMALTNQKIKKVMGEKNAS